ncbi:hypothetical protein ACVGWD_10765, partial [Enterobacter asburiae]
RRAASAFDHQDRLIGGRAARRRAKTTPGAAVVNINHDRAGFSVTPHKKQHLKKHQKNAVAHGNQFILLKKNIPPHKKKKILFSNIY